MTPCQGRRCLCNVPSPPAARLASALSRARFCRHLRLSWAASRLRISSVRDLPLAAPTLPSRHRQRQPSAARRAHRPTWSALNARSSRAPSSRRPRSRRRATSTLALLRRRRRRPRPARRSQLPSDRRASPRFVPSAPHTESLLADPPVPQSKLLSKAAKNPYAQYSSSCSKCKTKVGQGFTYCQRCAYTAQSCAMCGKTNKKKQSGVPVVSGQKFTMK